MHLKIKAQSKTSIVTFQYLNTAANIAILIRNPITRLGLVISK
jgi:hypothetical protein